MHYLLLLAVAATFASGKPLHILEGFEYGLCNGSNQPLFLDHIYIFPDPIIVVKPETDVILDALATLNEIIPVGSKVKLNIVKFGLIDLPFPCWNNGSNYFGSW